MVSVLDSGSSDPGFSLGRGVVYLSKALYTHSAPLHSGAEMGRNASYLINVPS